MCVRCLRKLCVGLNTTNLSVLCVCVCVCVYVCVYVCVCVAYNVPGRRASLLSVLHLGGEFLLSQASDHLIPARCLCII